MNKIRVSSYRKMLNIQRLSGTFKHRNYNLAEHSYYTTILFQHFADIEGVEYGIDELNLILRHDIVEVLTGDLIYTVKNSTEENKKRWGKIEDDIINNHKEFLPYSDSNLKSKLSDEQLRLFKACDLLELWIFLKEEWAIGNRNWAVGDIISRCVDLINGYCLLSGGREFYSIIDFMNEYVPWKE